MKKIDENIKFEEDSCATLSSEFNKLTEKKKTMNEEIQVFVLKFQLILQNYYEIRK